MSEVNTVATAFPKGRTVTLSDGTDVVIRRVTLNILAPALELTKKVFAELGVAGGTITADIRDPVFLLQLISNHTEEVYGLIVSLTSVSKTELLEMELDDSLSIFVALIEENQRFFIERILPLIAKYLPAAIANDPANAQ